MDSTPFNDKQLKEFRKLLIEKKARIIREIHEQNQFVSQKKQDIGDLADMATYLLEKELSISLSEKEREILGEIDKAIERIQNKTYGICVDTNKPIKKTRLKARPEAIRTTEAQEIYEKHQKKNTFPRMSLSDNFTD